MTNKSVINLQPSSYFIQFAPSVMSPVAGTAQKYPFLRKAAWLGGQNQDLVPVVPWTSIRLQLPLLSVGCVSL